MEFSTGMSDLQKQIQPKKTGMEFWNPFLCTDSI